MSQLHRLLNSFVGIITQYHQEKLGASGIKPRSIDEIVSQPHGAMVIELTSYISQATEHNETRRPLLLYILNGIERLKSLVDSNDPVADEAIIVIKKQLVDLVVQLKNLLTVSHSTVQTINYNNKDIELYGFVRGVLSRYSLCTSGKLIESTVFLALGLKPDANNEAIEEALGCIIDEQVKIVQSQYNVRTLEQKVLSLETQRIPHSQALLAAVAPTVTTQPLFQRPGQLGMNSFFSPSPSLASFITNLLAPPYRDNTPPRNHTPTNEI